jgi:hypothetical protein
MIYVENSGRLGNQLFRYALGVNCLEKLPSEYDKNKIVFVGNMRTLQNYECLDSI